VAIEMDDVIRLAAASSAVEFLPQSRQCGRAKDLDADQVAEFLHRFDQRQRTRPVIKGSRRLRPPGER
jgi:hypothetical protein